MAHTSTPHFHNTEGLKRIEVGSKEFMCVGALPPFDHPHIYHRHGQGQRDRLLLLLDALRLQSAAGAGHLAAPLGGLSGRTTPSSRDGQRWPHHLHRRGRHRRHDAGAGAGQVRRDRGRARAQRSACRRSAPACRSAPMRAACSTSSGSTRRSPPRASSPTASIVVPFGARKPLVTLALGDDDARALRRALCGDAPRRPRRRAVPGVPALRQYRHAVRRAQLRCRQP